MPSDRSRQVLDRIAASATAEQKQELATWADALLTIKESRTSTASKVADAIFATAKFSTITPLVTVIAKELAPKELSTLAEQLLVTHSSGMAPGAKLKRVALLFAKATKELGWDNRRLPGRLGMATAIATAIVFGGQGAGIAALGTAIGVPLWVVFGAGAAFLGEIYERFTGGRRSTTTYTVIDATQQSDESEDS